MFTMQRNLCVGFETIFSYRNCVRKCCYRPHPRMGHEPSRGHNQIFLVHDLVLQNGDENGGDEVRNIREVHYPP